MTSLSDHILGFSPFGASKSKTPFQMDQRKKPTIGFLFLPIREEHRQTSGVLLALLHCSEMFCLDGRCQVSSVKEQMWLSIPGGKDYQKCRFHEHIESRECSWLPGSQSLSQLPLKMFLQNSPYVCIIHNCCYCRAFLSDPVYFRSKRMEVFIERLLKS